MAIGPLPVPASHWRGRGDMEGSNVMSTTIGWGAGHAGSEMGQSGDGSKWGQSWALPRLLRFERWASPPHSGPPAIKPRCRLAWPQLSFCSFRQTSRQSLPCFPLCPSPQQRESKSILMPAIRIILRASAIPALQASTVVVIFGTATGCKRTPFEHGGPMTSVSVD